MVCGRSRRHQEETPDGRGCTGSEPTAGAGCRQAAEEASQRTRWRPSGRRLVRLSTPAAERLSSMSNIGSPVDITSGLAGTSSIKPWRCSGQPEARLAESLGAPRFRQWETPRSSKQCFPGLIRIVWTKGLLLIAIAQGVEITLQRSLSGWRVVYLTEQRHSAAGVGNSIMRPRNIHATRLSLAHK